MRYVNFLIFSYVGAECGSSVPDVIKNCEKE